MPRMIVLTGLMPQHTRYRAIGSIPRRVRRSKQPDHGPLQRRREMQRPRIPGNHKSRAPNERDHLPNRAGNQRRSSIARLHDPPAYFIVGRSSVHDYAKPPLYQLRRHCTEPLCRPLLGSPPRRRRNHNKPFFLASKQCIAPSLCRRVDRQRHLRGSKRLPNCRSQQLTSLFHDMSRGQPYLLLVQPRSRSFSRIRSAGEHTCSGHPPHHSRPNRPLHIHTDVVVVCAQLAPQTCDVSHRVQGQRTPLPLSRGNGRPSVDQRR